MRGVGTLRWCGERGGVRCGEWGSCGVGSGGVAVWGVGLCVRGRTTYRSSRFRVWGLVFRVQGLGFKGWGPESRVQGLRFVIWSVIVDLSVHTIGLEFRVWGLGFRV